MDEVNAGLACRTSFRNRGVSWLCWRGTLGRLELLLKKIEKLLSFVTAPE